MADEFDVFAKGGQQQQQQQNATAEAAGDPAAPATPALVVPAAKPAKRAYHKRFQGQTRSAKPQQNKSPIRGANGPLAAPIPLSPRGSCGGLRGRS